MMHNDPTEFDPSIPPPPPPNITNPYYPFPPKQTHRGLVVAVVCLSCFVLVLSGSLFVALYQLRQEQQPGTATTPTALSTLVLIPTPTAASHPGTLSKTPLLEKDDQGNWLCYAITKSEPETFAVFSNPNSSTVLGDCEIFIGQGDYYSSTPLKLVPGDKLQCEGWATDNTFWKLEALYNDLNTEIMCHDLEQAVPGTQG